ncbi:MAG: serine/threonine protein kinase [Myxococcales bacterium]|nr:serine/threonine protein kinase [Myxococcales bacterium]
MPQALFLVDWQCCLGAGGEGEVFLGRSVESGELCAIKVSTSIDPSQARRQLARELERCRRAAGRGTVGLVGWNLAAERPFIVFELAHAGSLADEMRQLRQGGQVYHPVRALQRIRETLEALAHVHARGLVHRDIKPDNLLRFGGGIKLGDFGTGKTLQHSGSQPGSGVRRSERASALEQLVASLPTPLPPEWLEEAFVGTRMYAAPEQLRGEEADERADLYGVGCILHEMLTGNLPDGDGRRLLRDYPSVLVLPELDRLLGSLLHPERRRRPINAHAAIARVDEVLESYRRARGVWQRLQLGRSPY